MPKQLKQAFDFEGFKTNQTLNKSRISRPLCSKCKANPRARGQTYCSACRKKAANASYWKKRRERLEQQQGYDTLMANNPITKARFLQRFGPSPHVYVPAGEAHPYNAFRGVVVAFRPGDIVAVMGEFDRSILAELHFSEIRRDNRAPEYRTPIDLVPGMPVDPELRRRLHLQPRPANFDGSLVQSTT